MTFAETLSWQRVNSLHINRLAKLGDALAKRLIEAYRTLYDDRFNPIKQREWMLVADDFARRDLTNTTRRILNDRYGHKLPSSYRRMDS